MTSKKFIDDMHKLRFKVIAAWPNMHPVKVGDILIPTFKNPGWYYKGVSLSSQEMFNLKHIFKKLFWFENRTIDELLSVQYVRITEYTGYWNVGDCVKVIDYVIDPFKKTIIDYKLEGNHYSAPEKCVPVTEKEYKTQRKIK